MKNVKMIAASAMAVVAGIALAGCSTGSKVEETVVEDVNTGEETVVVDEESAEPSKFVEKHNLAGAYALAAVETADAALIEEGQFAMFIDEYGAISGQVCNTFASDISEDGKTGPGVTTMMYCEDPEGIMELEQLVVDSLDGKVEVAENGVVFEGKTKTEWVNVDVIDVE